MRMHWSTAKSNDRWRIFDQWLPVWHWYPVYPGIQLQVKLSTLSMQLPPFWQGMLAHSSMLQKYKISLFLTFNKMSRKTKSYYIVSTLALSKHNNSNVFCNEFDKKYQAYLFGIRFRCIQVNSCTWNNWPSRYNSRHLCKDCSHNHPNLFENACNYCSII